MAVDINDFRRFKEGQQKDSKAQAPVVLLEQSNSALAVTGDARLDKLLRVLAASQEKMTQHALDVAHNAASCVKHEAIPMLQFEYAFSKGMLHAYAEVSALPAKIVAEETGLTIHSA